MFPLTFFIFDITTWQQQLLKHKINILSCLSSSIHNLYTINYLKLLVCCCLLLIFLLFGERVFWLLFLGIVVGMFAIR